jgi:hypothetical protein
MHPGVCCQVLAAAPCRAEAVGPAKRSNPPGRSGRSIVAFRSEAVIFSVLGLILYSDHDVIPCMAPARLTRAVPMLHEERHDTSSL